MKRPMTIDQRRDMRRVMNIAAGFGISDQRDRAMLGSVLVVNGHSMMPAQALFRRDLRIAGAKHQRDPKLSRLGGRWLKVIGACINARAIIEAHLRKPSRLNALFPAKRVR